MKKCVTIHLLLGNIRPRIRYRKMQIVWSFQGRAPWTSTRTLPWNCWGLVAPASTQTYCTMTDGHCMLCLRHDTRSRPKGKTSMTGGGGGGAINRAASPAASLPPRHCLSEIFRNVSKPGYLHCVRILSKKSLIQIFYDVLAIQEYSISRKLDHL